MKFKLGDTVYHDIDNHLTWGVVIYIMENGYVKVAWVGPGYVSVVHADFLRHVS